MPNWCEMEVTIQGDKETLEQIVAKGAEGTYEDLGWNSETRTYETIGILPNKFSFNNFSPVPKFNPEGEGSLESVMKAINLGKRGEYDNSYDWCVANWGTKWDLDQQQVFVSTVHKLIGETYQVFITGNTAWSPALPLFETISEQFPTVKIIYKYVEEGNSFMGRAEIENGEIDDQYSEITSSHLKQAGAVLDSNGDVDWEQDQDYDLMTIL